jgi:hypothetical protein
VENAGVSLVDAVPGDARLFAGILRNLVVGFAGQDVVGKARVTDISPPLQGHVPGSASGSCVRCQDGGFDRAGATEW